MAIAGALVGVGQLVGDDGDRRPEQRRDRLLTEQRLVALVVGMGDDGDAGGQQLGTGRVDGQRRAVRTPEEQPVVGARDLPVLQLRLGDRGAHVDVPQRRRLAPVGETTPSQAQEAALRGRASPSEPMVV